MDIGQYAMTQQHSKTVYLSVALKM